MTQTVEYYKTEKGKEAVKRYRQSEKGQLAVKRARDKYFKTEKGKEAVKRYRQSDKGKKVLAKASSIFDDKQPERKLFGELLIRYRLENGLSRDELAVKIDVTRRAIVSWEHGARNITKANQEKLIGLFGEAYKKDLKELSEKVSEQQ